MRTDIPLINPNKPYYKWYILMLATAIHGLIAGAERMCLPPLFAEITESLSMSMTQMMTVWAMDPLAGVFVSLGAGLLIDKFGVKRTLAAACFLAGATGALRGLSVDFPSMAVTMFMFGSLVAMMPTLLPKVTAIWFIGRRLALANSILAVGMTGGAMFASLVSATLFSPLLGGWRYVLLLYGIPPILLSVLWFMTAKEPERSRTQDAKVSEVPFREAISRVVRIKEVWIIGLVFMGAQGAFNSISGYLPSYLRDIGWDAVSADSALTLLIGMTAVSSIPMGIISDKLGSRKAVLIPSLFIVAVTLGAIPFFHGSAIWALITVNGLLRGSMYPLLTALVVEQRKVGPRYAGTAIGVVLSLAMVGASFTPPLGTAVAGIYGGGAAILAWAIISIISLGGFFFVKEAPLKPSRSAEPSTELRP
ncbi:MAG: CynX/NimT family MFS transporter [Dehalococcoidia bacterium]